MMFRSRDSLGQPAKLSRATKKLLYADVEKDLLSWIAEQRVEGLVITNVDLKRKALEIGKERGYNGFVASNGWIWGFRKRNSLVYRVPTHTARKSVFSAEDEVKNFTMLLNFTVFFA